ncbi:salutaridine reductase-like [Silene latifolia]|uniref:salutaridine reductase-like n=1 Tax=Silene latifolia TaxID=37657 RepID=UPI003D783B14
MLFKLHLNFIEDHQKLKRMASKQEYERIAVVTGANKGIGWEIVRQLATAGVTVVLTARDKERGEEATLKLHNLGLTNVVFHQLDVTDPNSITSLTHFIEAKFGKLDILVNNAGYDGMLVDKERLKALNITPQTWKSEAANLLPRLHDVMKTTHETAEACLNINYYGAKSVTEAFLPLLELSAVGARIVNVSSIIGELSRIPIAQIRNEFADVETLKEDRIHEILQNFLHHVKQDVLPANGWPSLKPAYGISKTALNAYTRLLAKKHQKMYINCVHPGHVDTDLAWHTGPMTPEEGALAPVKLALLPDGGPTGRFFNEMEEAAF